MAYIVNNKHIKQVSVLTEPNSYQTDIQPEDMQSGRTAISKGKIVTGTGRAFEFAKYGSLTVRPVLNENGESKFGIMIPEQDGINVLFVSTGTDGDVISQDLFMIDIGSQKVMQIGANRSVSSALRVYYTNGYLCIYCDGFSNTRTKINYFEGKDNLI